MRPRPRQSPAPALRSLLVPSILLPLALAGVSAASEAGAVSVAADCSLVVLSQGSGEPHTICRVEDSAPGSVTITVVPFPLPLPMPPVAPPPYGTWLYVVPPEAFALPGENDACQDVTCAGSVYIRLTGEALGPVSIAAGDSIVVSPDADALYDDAGRLRYGTVLEPAPGGDLAINAPFRVYIEAPAGIDAASLSLNAGNSIAIDGDVPLPDGAGDPGDLGGGVTVCIGSDCAGGVITLPPDSPPIIQPTPGPILVIPPRDSAPQDIGGYHFQPLDVTDDDNVREVSRILGVTDDGAIIGFRGVLALPLHPPVNPVAAYDRLTIEQITYVESELFIVDAGERVFFTPRDFAPEDAYGAGDAGQIYGSLPTGEGFVQDATGFHVIAKEGCGITQVVGVDDAGIVYGNCIGVITLPDVGRPPQSAFSWRDGEFQDFDPFGPEPHAVPTIDGARGAGLVWGWAAPAFVLDGDELSEIARPEQGYAEVIGVTDAGRVLAWSFGPPDPSQQHFFVEAGEVLPFATPPFFRAAGIGANGTVFGNALGQAWIATPHRAPASGDVVYTDGTDIFLVSSDTGVRRLLATGTRVASVTAGEDGMVYYASANGIFRVGAEPGDAAVPPQMLAGPGGSAIVDLAAAGMGDDGMPLVFATDGRTIFRLDLASGARLPLRSPGHTRSIAASADGRVFFDFHSDIRGVDALTGARIGTLAGAGHANVRDLALADDGTLVYTDGRYVYEVDRRNALRRKIARPMDANAVALDPLGRTIYNANADLYRYDPATGSRSLISSGRGYTRIRDLCAVPGS
jgi:hypothetical protein